MRRAKEEERLATTEFGGGYWMALGPLLDGAQEEIGRELADYAATILQAAIRGHLTRLMLKREEAELDERRAELRHAAAMLRAEQAKQDVHGIGRKNSQRIAQYFGE